MVKRRSAFATLCIACLCSSQFTLATPTTTDEIINKVLTTFSIPKVTHERQVGDHTKVMRRSFTFKSSLEMPVGSNYLVITDLTMPASLAALQKLAQVHNGKVVKLNDLRALVANSEARAQLLSILKNAQIAYLAIAPKIENYSENVVLALWMVLKELGQGKINVYPGFLVAADEQTFINLIDQNIQEFTANNHLALKPIVVAQSVSQQQGGLRAIEKADLFEVLLQNLNAPANGFVVRDKTAPPDAFPRVGNLGTLDVSPDGLLHDLPVTIRQAVTDARLMVLFGHGMPGMSCSIDVQAFRQIELSNHLILCGSCFSATPVYSDFSDKPRLKQPFFLRAIESGAPIFYGHMRTNGGFPQLFVVLEALLKGETIGQGYQRLLNAMITKAQLSTNQLSFPQDNRLKNTHSNNDLLYIMIGDPAIQPLVSDLP